MVGTNTTLQTTHNTEIHTMARTLVIHYSAFSNISYRGKWEIELDDDHEPTEEEIDEIILEMIFGDIDVYAEVVDE